MFEAVSDDWHAVFRGTRPHLLHRILETNGMLDWRLRHIDGSRMDTTLPFTPPYKQPSCLTTDAGEIRRVGFELEFSGITLEQAAQAVEQSLGGVRRVDTVAAQSIEVPDLGTFVVELDWAFLKKQASEGLEPGAGAPWLEPLSRAAAVLVPIEVVCPPVPMTKLETLDPMVQRLRQAGAVGTNESIIAAYGLHVNIELPSLDPATVHDYLRAYCLMQWWLVDAHDVDLARRLSPYIDLYPQAYIREVLKMQSPDMAQITAAYLQYNPSRNRALDLLPILAEMDVKAVRAVVDDDRVKARPAFHYRLPNCQIDQPDWSMSKAWNTWCLVEWLAQRPDDLDMLGKQFLDAERWVIGVDRAAWVEHMGQWLCDNV